MKIERAEVGHVAHLVRLYFSEEEKETLTLQLNNILMYMDILNQVDTTSIAPMSHAIDLSNAFRDDIRKESIGIEKTLANAPDKIGNCFRVPKVIA